MPNPGASVFFKGCSGSVVSRDRFPTHMNSKSSPRLSNEAELPEFNVKIETFDTKFILHPREEQTTPNSIKMCQSCVESWNRVWNSPPPPLRDRKFEFRVKIESFDTKFILHPGECLVAQNSLEMRAKTTGTLFRVMEAPPSIDMTGKSRISCQNLNF